MSTTSDISPCRPEHSDELADVLHNTVRSTPEKKGVLSLTLDNTAHGMCISWNGPAILIGYTEYFYPNDRDLTSHLSTEELVGLAKAASVIRLDPPLTAKTYKNGVTEVAVDELPPATNFLFFIVGKFGNNGGQLEWECAEVKTPYDHQVFSEPANLRNTQMSGKVFALEWKRPVVAKRPLFGYCVSMKDMSIGGSKTQSRGLSQNKFQFSFTELKLGSTYELAVCATDGVNVGPLASTIVRPIELLEKKEPMPKHLKFNCWWCDNQQTKHSHLNQHFNLKHEGRIKALYCNEKECANSKVTFISMEILINHMRRIHKKCNTAGEVDAFKKSPHVVLMHARSARMKVSRKDPKKSDPCNQMECDDDDSYSDSESDDIDINEIFDFTPQVQNVQKYW